MPILLGVTEQLENVLNDLMNLRAGNDPAYTQSPYIMNSDASTNTGQLLNTYV
jgi:hypothetical protein